MSKAAAEPSTADCKALLHKASTDTANANIARKAEIDRCTQSYLHIELLDCVLKLADANGCLDAVLAYNSAHSDEAIGGIELAEAENIGPTAPHPDDPGFDDADDVPPGVAMAVHEGTPPKTGTAEKPASKPAAKPKAQPTNPVITLNTGDATCDAFLSTINRCEGLAEQTRTQLASRLTSVFQGWAAMPESRRELLVSACHDGRALLNRQPCDKTLDQAMSAVATK